MPKVCLQAGHQNCEKNSIVALRGSTGAPGEMAFNVDVRGKVANLLRARGFEVVETDAPANDSLAITKTDWDLFLSIHYDADIYSSGGGFADFPEPSTDGATQESQRICAAIEAEYFTYTGVANKPSRRNSNTKYYYMWKYLTAKTPCVIIECGVGQHQPDDYQLLQGNRMRVAEGIAKGICRAFNVAWDLSIGTPASSAPVTIDGSTKIDLGPDIGVMEVQAIRSTILDLRRDLKVASDKLARISEVARGYRPKINSIRSLLG